MLRYVVVKWINTEVQKDPQLWFQQSKQSDQFLKL